VPITLAGMVLLALMNGWKVGRRERCRDYQRICSKLGAIGTQGVTMSVEDSLIVPGEDLRGDTIAIRDDINEVACLWVGWR